MVRIKFTGPDAELQRQASLARGAASKSSTTAVLHKTRNDAEKQPKLAAQEQLALKQQQSLEMVQIMLHVSLGTLFYLREFLPLSCFDDRDLKQAQRERKFSYQEFIHSKARFDKDEDKQDPAFGKGKCGQPLKIIIRDSDPKADAFLDVLEHGVFDVLKKGVLEAVQLAIVADMEAPSNILESYTFSFKYTGKPGDADNRLESLSLDQVGCVADMKSAQTARTGLEMIVRRLISLSTFLPALPNKRSLGVHLFYTKDCPHAYEPPGFSPGDDCTLNYPLAGDWRKESQSCGVMNSGSHTVGLKVTSLRWNGPDPEDMEAPEIPEEIEYGDPVSRFADIGFDSKKSLLDDQRCASGSFQEATQDVTERQKLQMMIPTQRTSPTPDNDLVPTQPVNNNAKTGTYEKSQPEQSEIVILSANKAAEINEYIEYLMGDTSPQDKRIRCQCAWDGEEPEMIECAFCHSRQHLRCYGFRDSNDPKMPDIHACYQCLLGQGETELLGEMHTLVLLRRALSIILTEGFQNRIPVFAQKLHCNGNTVIQITDLLKKQKFIQPTPGYKGKGFPLSGLPKYTIHHSEDVNQRMESEIFDPLAKIGHHYFKQIVDEFTRMSKIVPQGSEIYQSPHDDDSPMGTRIADEQTEESSTGFQTPQMSLRNRKPQMLPYTRHSQHYDTGSMDDKSGDPYQEDSGHADLYNSNHGTARPETPKSRPTISDRRVRRSGRKRRKISNYKQLIDVGAETSSDDSA